MKSQTVIINRQGPAEMIYLNQVEIVTPGRIRC